MSAVVALLRGINVGGHRELPMPELRSVVEQQGHRDVVTHLRSGNVVFVPGSAATPRELADSLAHDLHARLGVQVDVVVRALAELDATIAANPFAAAAEQDPSHVVVTFYPAPFARTPELDVARLGRERVVWTERGAYVHYPDGIGRSPLTAAVLDRAAGQAGTSRNWRTVLALAELVRARS